MQTVVMVVVLLAPAAPALAAEQKAPASPKTTASAPPPSAAIPLAEVAARAAEVMAILHSAGVAPDQPLVIAAVQSRLPEGARLGADLEEKTQRVLRGQPTPEALEAEQEIWVRRQLLLTPWLSALTQQATQLQATLTRLANEQKTWTQTQEVAQAAKAPAPVLQQIAGILAAIGEATASREAQRTTVLDLQTRVAREVTRCQAMLARIGGAQKQAVQGLLTQDVPPIWSAELWARARAADARSVRDMAAEWWAAMVADLRDPLHGLTAYLGVSLVVAGVLRAARRRVARGAAGEGTSAATAAFDRPFSAAMLIALFGGTTLLSQMAPPVREFLQALLLIPAIRLAQPVMDPLVIRTLSILGGLFALDTVRRALAGAPVLEPGLLSLEMLAGMLAVAYGLTLGGLRRPAGGAAVSERLRALRACAGLVLLLFAAALAAAVLGYLRLARLLASGVLGSAYLALVLDASVRVGTGVAALAFRTWPVRLLRMVRNHRDFLERRTHRVLVWAAVVAWVIRSLNYVGLLGPALDLGKGLLAAKLERGALSISVEDVLAFVLTLVVAYLLSAFLRFALEEDVYPRIGLTHGLTYALSSLLTYGLFALGFLAGLAVLGLDVTKLTVLAGAFGVGIGFGLQSVVNNFVSGLILLFERPIQVGDIIEAGDIMGNVRRIGIRASTVRTWQGAEIIVPNAQLITERVTNWTLSDRLRRIDLPVGVNYGASPKKVMEILEAVARAHPQVLRQPPAQAFFTGFGDSSINFELRAWTDQFENWFQIRSELATAVYDAGLAAGLSFPFPQREVRILHGSESGLPQPKGGDATPA